MDPISIISASAATLGLLNNLNTSVIRVHEIWEGVQQVDLVVEDLDNDLYHLQHLVSIIKGTLGAASSRQRTAPWPQPPEGQSSGSWDVMLQAACGTFDALERIFVDVTRQRSILPSIRQYYRYELYKEQIKSLRARINVFVSSLSCAATLLANRQTSADLTEFAATFGRGIRKLESCIEKLGSQVSLVADEVRLANWQRPWSSPPLGGSQDVQNTSAGASTTGWSQAYELEAASMANGTAAESAGGSISQVAKAELFQEDTRVMRIAETFAASLRQTASTVVSLGADRTEDGTTPEDIPAASSSSPAPLSSSPPQRYRRHGSPAAGSSPRSRPIHGRWNATVEDEDVVNMISGLQDTMAHLSVHPLAMNPRQRDQISDWAQEVQSDEGPPVPPPETVSGLFTPPPDLGWDTATIAPSEDSRPRNFDGQGTQAPGCYGRVHTSANPFPGPQPIATPAAQVQGELERLLHMARMFAMSQEYDKALKPLLLAAHKAQAESQLDRASCQAAFEMLGDAIANVNPFGGGYADDEIRGYPEVIAAVLKSRYQLANRFFHEGLFYASVLVIGVCLRVRSANPGERMPLFGHQQSRDLEPTTLEDSRYRPKLARGVASDGSVPSARPSPSQPDRFGGSSPYLRPSHEPSKQPGRPVSPLSDDLSRHSSPYRTNRQSRDLLAAPGTNLRSSSPGAHSSSAAGERQGSSAMSWKDLYCLPLWDQIHLLAARAWIAINPESPVADSCLKQLLGMRRQNTTIGPDVEYMAKNLQAEIKFSAMALDTAKDLVKEVVQGRQRSLGPEHLNTQQSIALLVAICQAKDDSEEMFWRDQTTLTYERRESTTSAQRLERCQEEVHALFKTQKAMAVELGAQFLDAEYVLDPSAPDRASLDLVREVLYSGNGDFWASRVEPDEQTGRTFTTWPVITYLMQSSPRGSNGPQSCSSELTFLLDRLQRKGNESAAAVFVEEFGFTAALRRAILQGKVDDTRVLCEHGEIYQDEFALLVDSVLQGITPTYAYPDVAESQDLPRFNMEDAAFDALERQLDALEEVIKKDAAWDVGDVVRTLAERHAAAGSGDGNGGGGGGGGPGLFDHPAVLTLLLDYADDAEACVNATMARTPAAGAGSRAAWQAVAAAPLLHHAVSHALRRAAGGFLVAGALQTVLVLVERGADREAADGRGYVAAQVAVEEAHLAEEADRAALAEDVLVVVWTGSAEAPDPRLRLHKLYRGTSAAIARLVAPQRSKLSRLFRSAS